MKDYNRYGELFQEFLDAIESWADYKLVLNNDFKLNYKWYKSVYQPTGHKYDLVPIAVEDLFKICKKAEACFTEETFEFALPLVAMGYYSSRSPIARCLITYLNLK